MPDPNKNNFDNPKNSNNPQNLPENISEIFAENPAEISPETYQTALGFDFGLAKIGVAFGQSITKTASPVCVLRAKDGQPDWKEVEKLLKTFRPQVIIVGLPLNMDESENGMCIQARKFAGRLHGRFGKVVLLVDERLSSTGVAYALEDMGQNRYGRARIDDLAACLILETFFRSLMTEKPKLIDPIVLVDTEDQPIGIEEKLKVHELGLLHRAFSVFVYRKNLQNQTPNKTIELLLQKRAAEKYHSAGLWTNTCCSHPRLNEELCKAGARRLWEEMKIQAFLKKSGSFIYRAEFENGLIEHEFDHVLSAEWDGIFNPDPKEVQETRWINLIDLDHWLADKPEEFTPWFNQAYQLWRKMLP